MSKFLKFSLASVLAIGIFNVSPIFAQDGEVEEVIVTGSKIKKVDIFDSSKPLEVVDAAQIERTGLNNIGDVLQNLTSSDGTGIRPVTTQTNGGDGSNEISLRNLGSGRTLVLVDGKRWVTNSVGAVDMQTIPAAIIQRVEILKDGASSIYGSDAVAGVINIITKKNFEGFEMRASMGEYEANYGGQNSVSLTFGSVGERTRNVFNISMANQEEIFAGDIPRANQPYVGCTNVPGSGTGEPNSPTNLGPSPDQNGGFGNFAPANGGFCGSSYPAYGRYFDQPNGKGRLIPGQAGTQLDHFAPWSNAGRYNYAPINHVQNPVDRVGVYQFSDFDFSDNLTGYVQFVYSKSERVNQIAQVPMTATRSAGPQWQLNNGRFATSDGYFNVLGGDTSFGFRAIAIGPRIYTYDYDVYGLRAGFDGQFEINGKTYFWNAGTQVNDARYDAELNNFVDLVHLANAVGPSFRDAQGNLKCGTPDEVIFGCTPFNIFGGPDLGLGAGVITQAEYDAMVSYVGYNGAAVSGMDSDEYWFEVSGPLFEMPAGTAYFAFGYEKGSVGYFDTPDALVSSGGSSTNFREPTSGGLNREEMFVELNFPLMEGQVGAQELELTVSARTSEFTSTGLVGTSVVGRDPGDPTTAEVGIRWKPIDDLLVRATFGETFRAPAVGDLYAGGGESFPQANDPCNTDRFPSQDAATQANCIAGGVPDGGIEQPTSQLRAFRGGNPNLLPEEGENQTFGIVYTPSQVEGLRLSIDFWEIELENILNRLGAQTVLNRCYIDNSNQDDGFCGFITRNPAGGIQTVRTVNVNSALQNVSGIDFVAAYDFDVDGYGSFTTAFDMVYYTKDEFAQAADSTPSESFGFYEGATDFRWRANASVLWFYEDFTTTLNFRFLDDQWEDCWLQFIFAPGAADLPCSHPDKGSYGYHEVVADPYVDLNIDYQYDDNISFTIGARNLLGQEPPLVFDAYAQNFDFTYDMPGGAFIYAGFKIRY